MSGVPPSAKYDGNHRVEGVIVQESALSLNGAYSQDVADGGTYTAEAWRDASHGGTTSELRTIGYVVRVASPRARM